MFYAGANILCIIFKHFANIGAKGIVLRIIADFIDNPIFFVNGKEIMNMFEFWKDSELYTVVNEFEYDCQ